MVILFGNQDSWNRTGGSKDHRNSNHFIDSLILGGGGRWVLLFGGVWDGGGGGTGEEFGVFLLCLWFFFLFCVL